MVPQRFARERRKSSKFLPDVLSRAKSWEGERAAARTGSDTRHRALDKEKEAPLESKRASSAVNCTMRGGSTYNLQRGARFPGPGPLATKREYRPAACHDAREAT